MSEPSQGSCGVCGRPILDGWFHPPTVSNIQAGTSPDGKTIMKPVLSKPIRMDPETGAVCWCPAEAEPIAEDAQLWAEGEAPPPSPST